MGEHQHTLRDTIAIGGRGLHTGASARVVLRPAPPDAGVSFRRSDLEGAAPIPARPSAVRSVEWETALGAGEATVRTVEHLLAALHALDIDNAEIEVDGPELPALDGSAGEWCDRILACGVETQDAPARVLEIREPIHVERAGARYAVLPYDGYRVTGRIRFEHAAIGDQFASVEVEPDTFRDEVGRARTFGLAAWERELKGRGLALGATPENTLIIGDGGLEEGSKLRYPDEFVRHKILDLIGDLALVGARLRCHVVAERPGHRGNIVVAKRLRERLDPTDAAGFDIQTILEYIPHRYPMLLVDRVLDFEEGERIVGVKNVTINEPFFNGHFPGHPIMPGVLIVEALAQCGGLLVMNEVEEPAEKVVYFMSLDDVKFRRPVRPGDQLRLEVEMLQFRRNVCKMKGVALVDGQVAAEATMMASIVDR